MTAISRPTVCCGLLFPQAIADRAQAGGLLAMVTLPWHAALQLLHAVDHMLGLLLGTAFTLAKALLTVREQPRACALHKLTCIASSMQCMHVHASRPRTHLRS